MANGLIILDRDNDGGGMQMRHHMRNNMRHHYGSSDVSMKNEREEGYKKGYEEGWQDCMEECGLSEQYRRGRDSQGRFV